MRKVRSASSSAPERKSCSTARSPNGVLLSIFDMAHLPHAKSRCVLLKIYNEHAIADLLLKGIFEAENDSLASGAFLENIE